MKRPLRVLPLLASLSLLAASTSAQTTRPVSAVAAAVERFAGHYRYAESADVGQRRVRRAAAPILQEMNPIVRLIAEHRLNDTHVPRHIEIRTESGEIAIRFAGDEDLTYRGPVGRPRTITLDSGGNARLTHLLRDGQLQQIFEGERGRWYNVFRLDESARHLHLEVVITGARLDEPLRVNLPYTRTR